MTFNSNQKPNRLANEKSPYLLQHAFNPVNWFPWSEEAFETAKRADKPVFLSIGYSTCHWCHVMEKESFEDNEIAQLLNVTFICIKVDREERPDLDATYLQICQTLTGSGGWPLHIIMTPDKKPFFAATYIPKEEKYGRPGIKELTKQIRQLWISKRQELLDSANKITDLFAQDEKAAQSDQEGEKLGEHLLHETYLQLADNYDEQNGGFGHAPKFPSPQNLTFLLRYWKRTGYLKALEMVEKTLRAMMMGGIYDHLGFGFHRYSTDSKWLVPHFEKMLYDQAMLLIAYAEAFQATRNVEFKQTAHQIATYVLREMVDPQGGFYSAQDADTEGVEGKYYLWTEEQINGSLPEEQAKIAKKIFSIELDGNYEDVAAGEKIGNNILFMKKTLAEIAEEIKTPLPKLLELAENCRESLFVARSKRAHPNTDDKILTDWNGLMITALAESARVLDEPTYATAAKKAADFIITNMFNVNKDLYHRYRDGNASIPGFLEDYAFFTWGLIELYETIFETKYLKLAIDLQDKTLRYFGNQENKGFFQTAGSSETTLRRNMEAHDGPYPSGNSVAAFNMIRLAHLTGETQFEERATELMQAFSPGITAMPSSFTQMMIALDFAFGPSSEIVVAGNPKNEDATGMLKILETKFLPRKVVLLRNSSKTVDDVVGLAKFTEYMLEIDGKATAYVCRNRMCNMPTTETEVMLHQVDDQL